MTVSITCKLPDIDRPLHFQRRGMCSHPQWRTREREMHSRPLAPNHSQAGIEGQHRPNLPPVVKGCTPVGPCITVYWSTTLM